MMTNVPTPRWILCAAMVLAPVAVGAMISKEALDAYLKDPDSLLASSSDSKYVSFEDLQGNRQVFQGLHVTKYSSCFQPSKCVGYVVLHNVSPTTTYTLHALKALFYTKRNPTPQDTPTWTYTLAAEEIRQQRQEHKSMEIPPAQSLTLYFSPKKCDTDKLVDEFKSYDDPDQNPFLDIQRCPLVITLKAHTIPVPNNPRNPLRQYPKTSFCTLLALVGTLAYVWYLPSTASKSEPTAPSSRRRASHPRQPSPDEPSMPPMRQPDEPSHIFTPLPFPTPVAQA